VDRNRIADTKTQIGFSLAVLLSGLLLFLNNLNETAATGSLLRTLGALFLAFGITALRAVLESSSKKGGE
jgi:hypothetical protein